MWGSSLAVQAAAQLEAPSAASSLAHATLWEQQSSGWSGGSLPQSQQHISPVAQRGMVPGQHPGLAWHNPGPPDVHTGHHPSSTAKIYVQGLPQSLQHPVAVAGLFSPFGDVLDVKLYAAEVRLSGGSAVVRMHGMAQAAAAIAALNGVVPEGGWQQLTVRAAETAEQRSSRITAINGRQQGGLLGPSMGMGLPSPRSPMQVLVGGPASAAALRRVQSARVNSQGSLQCYTSGPVGEQRASLDWVRDGSMHSSRRSSIEAVRTASAVFGRCSSDSGSGGEGSGSEEMTASEAGSGGSGAGIGPPSAEAQRMLLEAVLALVGQVEGGQLSMSSMRAALENALVAAKSGVLAGGEEPPLLQAQGSNGRLPSAPAAFRA